jgi:hypothetical protein
VIPTRLWSLHLFGYKVNTYVARVTENRQIIHTFLPTKEASIGQVEEDWGGGMVEVFDVRADVLNFREEGE